MTPDQFKALYGKAMAGDQTWEEAVAVQKKSPGASGGSKAVAQAKTNRAKAVVAPNASPADTFDDSSISSQGLPPPEQPAPSPPREPEPPAARQPLYTQLGGMPGIEKAGQSAVRALGEGLDAAPGKFQQYAQTAMAPALAPAVLGARLGAAIGQPIGGELAFQGKPILDEANLYRKRLMAALGGR